MTDQKVFITDTNILCSIASNSGDFFQNYINGKQGIFHINSFNVSALRTKIAGYCKDVPLQLSSGQSRIMTFLDIVCSPIIDKIKNEMDLDHRRIGIIVGTGAGPLAKIAYESKNYYTKGPNFINPMTVINCMSSILSSEIGIKTGFQGFNLTVNSACSSSLHAMSIGAQLIKNGTIDGCLVVGIENPVFPVMLKAWDKLRVMSDDNDTPIRASRPFSKNRRGMILAELAGSIFLASENVINGSKKEIELLGIGTSNDAFDLTKPNSKGQLLAYKSLFTDINIHPKEIDHIHAHGTGTLLNDTIETSTIKEVYQKNAYKIPICSSKSLIGHSLGASGMASTILSIQGMKEGIVPQTHNLEIPDPECDLDYVANDSRKMEIKNAVIHSFAFGGSNAIVAIRRN